MNAVTFSVFSDDKSPFWLAQLVLSDGKRLKKSIKVLEVHYSAEGQAGTLGRMRRCSLIC